MFANVSVSSPPNVVFLVLLSHPLLVCCYLLCEKNGLPSQCPWREVRVIYKKRSATTLNLYVSDIKFSNTLILFSSWYVLYRTYIGYLGRFIYNSPRVEPSIVSFQGECSIHLITKKLFNRFVL